MDDRLCYGGNSTTWFDTEIIYAKGSENRIVDCLSHYYEREEGDSTSDEEINWANVDVCLDPEGDDLPQDKWLELKAITIEGESNPWKSKCLAEKRETCTLEAQEMASAMEKNTEDTPHTNVEEDLTVFETTGTSQVPLVQYRDQPRFLNAVCRGYKSEPILAKVSAPPSHFPQFTEKDGLLYMKNRGNEEVLCLPHTTYKGDSIITMIINQAHRAIGHFGAQKTADYIHREYWWLKIGREVDKFNRTCPTCQATKPSNQLPQGLLHSLLIPRQPWGLIAMDFMGPFPPSEGHDYLWQPHIHGTLSTNQNNNQGI